MFRTYKAKEILKSMGLHRIPGVQKVRHFLQNQRLQRLAGERIVQLPEGFKMKLKLDRYIDARIASDGDYEEATRHTFLSAMAGEKYSHFLDIGANVGLFSLAVQAKFPEIEVYGFEPAPDLFEDLKSNMDLNGYSFVLFNKALSQAEGQLKFYCSTQSRNFDHGKINSGTNSLVYNQKRHDKSIDVEVSCLDKLFQSWSGLNIAIKIDVEGHELDVLKGGEKLLERNNCLMLVESFEPQNLEVQHYLEKLNYSLQVKLDEGNFLFKKSKLCRV